MGEYSADFCLGIFPNGDYWGVEHIRNMFCLMILPRLRKKYGDEYCKTIKISVGVSDCHSVDNDEKTLWIISGEYHSSFGKVDESFAPYAENLSRLVNGSVTVYRRTEESVFPIINANGMHFRKIAALAVLFAFEKLFVEYPYTTEEEKALAELIDKNNPALINALLEPHLNALRKQEEEACINELIDGSFEAEAEDIKERIKHCKHEYERCLERLQQEASDIAEYTQLLKCIESRTKADLENYKKVIELLGISISKSDNNLHNLLIENLSYLTNYDMDYAETVIVTERGSAEFFGGRKYLQPLFKAIFIDRRYKIRVYQKYIWSKDRRSISSGCDVTLHNKEKSAIANPHIYHYSCFGTGRGEALGECLMTGNWEGFFAEIKSVTSCIGFNDASARMFLEDVAEMMDEKFIEDKSGNIFTPQEILDKLKEEEQCDQG